MRWRSISGFKLLDTVASTTSVVRTCLPIIRPGKDRLARLRDGNTEEEKGKDKVSGGKTTSIVKRTGLSRVTEGSGRQTEMGGDGCEVIGGTATILRVKGTDR